MLKKDKYVLSTLISLASLLAFIIAFSFISFGVSAGNKHSDMNQSSSRERASYQPSVSDKSKHNIGGNHATSSVSITIR